MAAFELASMAAASDENKFLIVAEGGLDVLISLSLSDDASTQEYAAETLAELLTVPEIQVCILQCDEIQICACDGRQRLQHILVE